LAVQEKSEGGSRIGRARVVGRLARKPGNKDDDVNEWWKEELNDSKIIMNGMKKQLDRQDYSKKLTRGKRVWGYNGT